MALVPGVFEMYKSQVAPMMAELGLDNQLAAPRLKKVVVSMGLGSCLGDRKKIDEAVSQLSRIVGQKAVVTRARRSVSGFRLREGSDVGCCVTLRKERMYSFLTRLFFLVLPRVRDFRGLRTTAFDSRGNYSFGIAEQSVFSEIDPETVTFSQGMNVSIVTSAGNDVSGRMLMAAVGLPFVRAD